LKRLVYVALGLAVFCGLSARLASQSDLRAVVHASGFLSPVAIVQHPSDPSTQFVLEQGGRLRVAENGAPRPGDFLDLRSAVSTGGERGLLGMALSPDYAVSGRFFVNFTNTSGHTVIARFRRAPGALQADPASRFDLRWNGAGGAAHIVQPFPNHNGGHLAFGPDGYLYIGLGDGGSADDPQHLAQSPSALLGKMLRVDVGVADDDAIGYRVPPTNPFVAGGPAGTRPEVWAFGLRNPWRYSFDPPALGGTGALLIGDVGQNRFEEIDYEPPNRGGRNYGWRNREGAHDHVATAPPTFRPLIDPIHEYDHATGLSVTGGYVYRGSSLPSGYVGRYFFADFSRGRVWSMALSPAADGEARAGDVREHTDALSSAGSLGAISSFGVDANGELFLVSYSTGTIFRIAAAGPSTPTRLRIIR
jgi:glucose/arabinose dehydrogenase